MSDPLMMSSTELRAALAETRAYLEFSRSENQQIIQRSIVLERERDALQEQLAQAQADTERMDYLEREREYEQEYLVGKREWTGPALFRQNVQITRKLIDSKLAALRAKQEPPQALPPTKREV